MLEFFKSVAFFLGHAVVSLKKSCILSVSTNASHENEMFFSLVKASPQVLLGLKYFEKSFNNYF